ncbi:MAG: hypothetical protein AB7Y74_01555 [Syntrophorhabdus sp.]
MPTDDTIITSAIKSDINIALFPLVLFCGKTDIISELSHGFMETVKREGGFDF